MSEVSTENQRNYVKFTDRAYKSRVLIAPDGRSIRVAGRQVSVPDDDNTIIDYLSAHPDFERLQ